MATLRKDCPVCETAGVINVFSTPKCTNCGFVWKDYTEFRDMFIGRTRAPAPGSVVQDDYITSGQLERDIADVVERTALEARFLLAKDLGAKAAKIVTDGITGGTEHDVVINDLLQLMVDTLKDSMRDIGKEPAGE